jgi:hypothetical protein
MQQTGIGVCADVRVESMIVVATNISRRVRMVKKKDWVFFMRRLTDDECRCVMKLRGGVAQGEKECLQSEKEEKEGVNRALEERFPNNQK